MEIRTVDVAIIGSGSAGLNARREVEKAGGRPLLIESGDYGTTCARVGCMPSKLLIAAADVAHEVAGAARFGIEVDDAWRIDGRRVMERVRAERDRFVGFVVEDTEALPEEQRLIGRARFVGSTTLEVGGHTRVEAGAVVIAAGSTPVIPPPFNEIITHVMVNDDVFDLPDLPESIAVIGTGIIGLELGQALARLGVRTSFFTPFDELGPITDPEVRRVVREVLTAELDMKLKSEILSALPQGAGVQLHWRDADGQEQRQHFERVLIAAGRRPGLPDLELQNTGLELDDRGIPHWDPRTTQCGDAPIFLAGDVSGHIPLLHEATDEGRIAGANSMLYPNVSAHVRRAPLAIAFTDPQVAMVGMHYDQLDLNAVEIGQVSFDNQGRSRVMGQNRGILRVYGDRECCSIIGAEMFGPRVEHMAHLLAWVTQERMTVRRALEMPFYHPVVEEGLRTALRDLAARLKVTGDCRSEDMATAPGT